MFCNFAAKILHNILNIIDNTLDIDLRNYAEGKEESLLCSTSVSAGP